MTTTETLHCIAHRGGRKLGPENTLATITRALALDVDAIEIDVWRAGGQLLVTHDRELGRVIFGQQRLLDLGPNEIANLRHIDGSPVANLEQVIDLVGSKARLNIELKGPDCAAAVADLVRQKNHAYGLAADHIVVSSFDHQQLRWLQSNAPEIKRGVLVYGIPHDGLACCEALGAYSFHPSIDFIDPDLIAEAREKKLEVWVYTVNRQEDFKELLALGVTGVFTDDPALLLEFNRRQKQGMPD